MLGSDPDVPEDVARAIALYADTDITVPEITTRTGVRGNIIYKMLPKLGLLSRRQTRERQKLMGREPASIVPHITARIPANKTLVRRLKRLAHVQLTQLETEMTNTPPGSTSTGERHVRVLRNLLKTLQEVASLEQQLKPKRNHKEKALNDDRQRVELAKCIAALRARDG